MKPTPEQLNARAFGEDPAVDSKENSTAEASQAESAEKKDEASSEADNSVVEQKVPYSRLKTVVERARLAEQKAEDAERRLQDLESRREESRGRSNEPYEEAIAARIKKLYGYDTPERQKITDEIIEIQLAQAKELEERAERKAIEALDRRETSSRSEIESNERVLEEKLEDFSLSLGRDLTQKEEDELLAIADQYSPTGEDGKYLSGEPLPLDRAWEIYEMKRDSQGQKSKRSRSEATELTGTSTDGDGDTKPADSESWRPGRWRDRFK